MSPVTCTTHATEELLLKYHHAHIANEGTNRKMPANVLIACDTVTQE